MKVILFANTDWYLYNYRMPLAKTLQNKGHEVVLLTPAGEYYHHLVNAGFRWIEFPISRRGKNPFTDILAIFRLIRLFKIEKPDAVQHFTIKCVLYGSMAARINHVKTVINAIPGLGYVFISNRWQDKLLRKFVKVLYRITLKNTRVIFQNPDDQSLFLNEKIVESDQQILIKGSGVDLQHFTLMHEPEGNPLVVLPARMLWAKGISEFVAAAKIVKSNGAKARFILVGDSDPETAGSVPQWQLKSWQDEGDIEWWGWQEDIRSILKQTHIVCLPSYYGEGVPRSLVEAAACGKPIIAADMPGSREIVKHGLNGFLVKPKDSYDLAKYIQLLLNDANLRSQMGIRGREFVEAEFSLEKTLSKNIELFEKTLV